MIKNAYTKKKIDFSKYVNIETGETLDSEVPGISSINAQSNQLQIVSSEEYMIVDKKAIDYIRTYFNRTEMARIGELQGMVHGCFNIVYKDLDNKIPHSKETLMEEFDYTRNKFALFMKKLYQKSVIYYISGYKDGREVTHIMLNPFIARKQKTFHTECVSMFQDLSKQKIKIG